MTYIPEQYWPDRFARQGATYVAKGGRPESPAEQVKALTPYLRSLPDSGRVLDFGCGPGRFRPALEVHGLDYEGVDLIPGLGTMEASDLRPQAFDCAVAIFVLQHIVDEEAYLSAVGTIYDALVPGGQLLVVDAKPMADPDEHMMPRGPEAVWESRTWYGWRRLGSYDGHWIAVFRR